MCISCKCYPSKCKRQSFGFNLSIVELNAHQTGHKAQHVESFFKTLQCQFIMHVSRKTVLKQSNLKLRPEKPGIISISLTLACSILKSFFRFNLICYMSWLRWMVSDSNKFVLIRSKGRGSVGKQLVLRTASTHQFLVKARRLRSWLHWDWLLKWWGCTATTTCSVIVELQITSINETAGFTYCRVPQRREKICLILKPFDLRYVQSDTMKF